MCSENTEQPLRNVFKRTQQAPAELRTKSDIQKGKLCLDECGGNHRCDAGGYIMNGFISALLFCNITQDRIQQ